MSDLKRQIIVQLNLKDLKPEDIGDDQPLFVEGLGLDSIDALELIVLLHAVDVARTVRRGQALTGALALASAVTIQATLGIVTLVHQAPLALALLHQTMALVVLTIAVEHGKRLAREPIQVGAAAHDAATRHWGQAT